MRENHDLPREFRLASLGEVTGPLAHEVNNFLNVLLLQIAVLEQSIPEKHRPDLAEIRRQGRSLASLVRLWQQYRYQDAPELEAVDLNQIVMAVVQFQSSGPIQAAATARILLPQNRNQDTTSLSVPAELSLAANLPPVLALATDLRRLVHFLVLNAATATGAENGAITIRTEESNDRVLLSVADNGPPIDPPLREQLFDLTSEGRPGTNRLELAACKSIARRLQAGIRCANRSAQGLIISVDFRRA